MRKHMKAYYCKNKTQFTNTFLKGDNQMEIDREKATHAILHVLSNGGKLGTLVARSEVHLSLYKTRHSTEECIENTCCR